MPSIGRFSFLPMTSSVTRWFPRIRCQCPQSGNPHFYHCRHHLKGGPNECVNALNRAILISTLPSWNQLFKPLSGLVSAGIFQNILTIILNRGQMWVSMPSIGQILFLQTVIHITRLYLKVSMPLVGQILFLPCPSGTGCFSHFPGSFLQVFFRIFW